MTEKLQKTNVKKRCRKRGRPKKRRPFNQTNLGFMIQHEAPVEYQLIMEAVSTLKLRTPPAELIEAIGYASDSPLFTKAKYWRDLIEYRKTGLYPKKPKFTDAKKELYYIHLRQKSI